MRIAICTPCQDQVSAGYAMDLAKLVGYTTRQRADIDLVLFHVRGSILPQSRTQLVRSALSVNAEAILWVDADQRFPKDALLNLLAHQQPIVATNYPTRRPPILPVAEDTERGRLFTDSESTGLADVSHAGMGLMLVRTAVFQAIDEPWFALGFSKSEGMYLGEDVFFCRRAKEAGFPTVVDQDVSRDVKHIGEMEFTHQHAAITRDAYIAKPRIALVEG